MSTQISVIGLIEVEVSTKTLRNLSEKLRGKLPSSSLPGYSMVTISRLDDAFSEILELKASPIEGQQLQQKDKKRRKMKSAKKK